MSAVGLTGVYRYGVKFLGYVLVVVLAGTVLVATGGYVASLGGVAVTDPTLESLRTPRAVGGALLALAGAFVVLAGLAGLVFKLVSDATSDGVTRSLAVADEATVLAATGDAAEDGPVDDRPAEDGPAEGGPDVADPPDGDPDVADPPDGGPVETARAEDGHGGERHVEEPDAGEPTSEIHDDVGPYVEPVPDDAVADAGPGEGSGEPPRTGDGAPVGRANRPVEVNDTPPGPVGPDQGDGAPDHDDSQRWGPPPSHDLGRTSTGEPQSDRGSSESPSGGSSRNPSDVGAGPDRSPDETEQPGPGPASPDEQRDGHPSRAEPDESPRGGPVADSFQEEPLDDPIAGDPVADDATGGDIGGEPAGGDPVPGAPGSERAPVDGPEGSRPDEAAPGPVDDGESPGAEQDAATGGIPAEDPTAVRDRETRIEPGDAASSRDHETADDREWTLPDPEEFERERRGTDAETADESDRGSWGGDQAEGDDGWAADESAASHESGPAAGHESGPAAGHESGPAASHESEVGSEVTMDHDHERGTDGEGDGGEDEEGKDDEGEDEEGKDDEGEDDEGVATLADEGVSFVDVPSDDDPLADRLPGDDG